MRKRPLLGCWFAVACVVIAGAAACGGSGASDGGDTAGGDTHQSEMGTVSGGEPLGPANEGIEGVEAFRVESHTHTDEPL